MPFFSPPQQNVPYEALISFLLSDPSCTPSRLHFGKGGWPDTGCWNGAEEYKDTWCDFGCAAFALDPYNKFAGEAADR